MIPETLDSNPNPLPLMQLPELTEITISPPTSMLSLNLGTVRNAQGQPVTITTQARKF